VSKSVVSSQQVAHVAQLSNLKLSEDQLRTFPAAFSETLSVVDQLRELNVADVEPTHQVTGLENIWREDKIQEEYMFTQAQALANAAQTHEGFIVVPQIIEQTD
jgi:aspartyl-tRNA(Asn)/glutamyl-tRNA(Gln) amidotransferase subunit C